MNKTDYMSIDCGRWTTQYHGIEPATVIECAKEQAAKYDRWAYVFSSHRGARVCDGAYLPDGRFVEPDETPDDCVGCDVEGTGWR